LSLAAIEQENFPVLPSERPIRVSLRQRLNLIVSQALFFPEFWPQVANDSAQDWRQLLADEATARMQIERRIGNGEIAQVVLRAPNVLNP